jgi:hypothetical protein
MQTAGKRKMRSWATLAALLMCAAGTQGQTAALATVPAAPQTARQALLEMLFSKTPGTFTRHLPAATNAALGSSDAMKSLQQFSLLTAQFQTPEKSFQTFETGSVLISAEDTKTGQKFEATVESDSLQGDQDDIELSFQSYKAGEPQKSPFMPRLMLTMKMESEIWTLNEISITIRMPLADPDFLKSVTETLKARAAAASTAQPVVTLHNEAVGQNPMFAGDPQVIAAMRTILTAETTYANTYRATGYTCTLSDLDGFGSSEANEHQAMLINSGLASGHRYNYVFTLSECGRAPAKTFRLTVAPNASNFGRRTYCADQSGAIKSSPDTNPAACGSNGTPVQ